MTAARAARAGAIVGLVGAAVALSWKAFFFSYSGWAFAWLGLAVLCLALTGAVHYAGERRASRAVGVALIATVVVAVITWISFVVWLASNYRD